MSGYYRLLLRCNFWPDYYPPDTTIRILESEHADAQWSYDDTANKYAALLGMKSWVSVSTVLNISWEEWKNLDRMARRYLELETQEIIRQREQHRREQEAELKHKMAEANSKLKFMDTAGSNVSRLLNR